MSGATIIPISLYHPLPQIPFFGIERNADLHQLPAVYGIRKDNNSDADSSRAEAIIFFCGTRRRLVSCMNWPTNGFSFPYKKLEGK